MSVEILALLFLSIFPLLLFFINSKYSISRKSSSAIPSKLPKSYPILGITLSIFANAERRIQWVSDLIGNSPTSTYVIRAFMGHRHVLTGNPSNVHQILKTNFHNYKKGHIFQSAVGDVLGDGIFNANGETWKFQRQVASHEFNTKSLRKFVETVVDKELSDRFLPMLSAAATDKSVIDLQDFLQRFSFDTICQIAFGHDPAYLLPSLPESQFGKALNLGIELSAYRLNSIVPIIWRLNKKFLCIGSEKRLKIAVSEVRDFAKSVIREKKQELKEKSFLDTVDLLSRFLSSGHSDEDFVTDIIINFIIAGRDTTSAALTWYFWLVSENPRVEEEILKEIRDKSEAPVYDEVKTLVYTHASLCESMRLYPPIPVDTKDAIDNDMFPDGTVVQKGDMVTYSPYAMGRLEELWGSDWAEFRPERWLETDPITGKWIFISKDPYTYTVFQAGPRICLGRDMAFVQMKRVAASVLRRFRVVSAVEGGSPFFMAYLTSLMKCGFPVRLEERVEKL